jgi:hypothetical protein
VIKFNESVDGETGESRAPCLRASLQVYMLKKK